MAPTRGPARPARILFISLYSEMGGGEHTLLQLLRRLDRTKFEPVVMFNRRGPFTDLLENEGIPVRLVEYPVMMLAELIRAEKYRALKNGAAAIGEWIASADIDCIQCSDVLTLLMIRNIVRHLRIPVVFSAIFPYEWTRRCVLGFLARGIRVVIANSAAVGAGLFRTRLRQRPPVMVVYPGVDPSVFRPLRPGERNSLRDELGIPDRAALVGMVGRIDPMKGQLPFLQAVKRCTIGRSDLRFVMIGSALYDDVLPPVKRYAFAVEEFRRQNGLDGMVTVLSHRSDIAAAIRSLNLLVCPSLLEGFGLVVTEALASGVPVVVSRTAGVCEVVRDLPGVTLAEPGDPDSLAAAIGTALDGGGPPLPDITKKKPELTWEAYAGSMGKIYDDCLDQPG